MRLNKLNHPHSPALLLGILLAGAPAGNLLAKGPGDTALPILQLGESVRQAALGGAGVAAADEAAYAYLNPAGLGRVQIPEAYFSYTRLFEGAGMGALAYGRRTDHWGFGGGLHYLDYGDFSRVDNADTRTGDTTASEKIFSLSAAPVRRRLTPGVTVKLAQQTLAGESALGPAVDAGVLWDPPARLQSSTLWDKLVQRLTLGLAVRNLGPGVKFDAETAPLPLSITAGLTHRGWHDAVSLSVDAERSRALDSTVWHVGGEAWVKEGIALRLGYRTDQDAGPGISAGLGFKLGDWGLDYAFRPFKELGETHRIGLSVRLGKSLFDKYYTDGLQELRKGHYAEAILLFNKALLIDPHDRRVVRDALEAANALDRTLKEPDAVAP